jgi:GTPase
LHVLLPYTRGDLVARLHDSAEILASEHTPSGTRMQARVDPALAAELAPFVA